MSMLLMVKAMELKVGNPLRKLVLIKLADNANDNGECFPSHNTIAKACEISRSSVQSHIEALIKMGLVKKINRKKNSKENTSNLYILTIPTDGIGGIPTDNTGIPRDGIGGIPTDEQEPVITEPVTKPIKKLNKKELDLSKLNEQPTEQVWSDYLEFRKSKRANLTQSALNILINQINLCNEKGIRTDEILSECMLRGWQGFKADWILKSDVKNHQKTGVDWHSTDWADQVAEVM